MKHLTLVALLTLILVNNPIGAMPTEACPGLNRDSAVMADGHRAMSCLASEKATPVKQSPDTLDRCNGASGYDSSSLVELHRSIRDGGLGVLRRPSNVFDAPAAVQSAGPAHCRLG